MSTNPADPHPSASESGAVAPEPGAAARSTTTTGIAAVRGAVPVRENSAAAILGATSRLITVLMETNALTRDRIVSALFTATEDLDADYPAHAARRLGWIDVPLLNAREIPVPGSMPRVVRVLLTVSGVHDGARLTPVYLDETAALRPDIVKAPAGPRLGRPPRRRRVAIIGLGQIGGSIGLALARASGWHRIGYDLDRTTLERAVTRGAIDEAARSLAEACGGAELAVLATPVDTLQAVIEDAAAALPPGAALLDTGSARRALAPAIEAAAARGVAAVGGHPLAGNAGRGLAAARAELFQSATFALSPTSDDVPSIVLELIEAVGARPMRVEPATHDAALARTSHLPYLVACALEELGASGAAAGLCGPTFNDMTRVAASDPRVARAYVRANAAEVKRAWRELRAALDRMVGDIDAKP